MPFGIGIGQALGLVREARQFEASSAYVAVSGAGAYELAAALAAGGDSAAVAVDGDPVRAAVAIRLVDGQPATAEIATLRRISSAGTPLLVLRRGGGERLPYVLPGDVLEVGTELPVADAVAALARVAGDTGPALAARLPVLRSAVERRLIGTTSLANAAIAASPWMKHAQLPVLTISQARMLLLLGLSRGDMLPRDPKALALAAGPSVLSPVAVGLGARELVRRLPFGGPVIRAAVAYAATQALGAARLRL